MRKTNQKDAILTAVLSMKNHPSADQIYYILKQDIAKLSLGTVYRNLNTFAQQNKIRKIVVPNASDRFDYRMENHEHFLCKKCGQLFDAEVHFLLETKNTSFSIEDYTLLLHGLCPACKTIGVQE